MTFNDSGFTGTADFFTLAFRFFAGAAACVPLVDCCVDFLRVARAFGASISEKSSPDESELKLSLELLLEPFETISADGGGGDSGGGGGGEVGAADFALGFFLAAVTVGFFFTGEAPALRFLRSALGSSRSESASEFERATATVRPRAVVRMVLLDDELDDEEDDDPEEDEDRSSESDDTLDELLESSTYFPFTSIAMISPSVMLFSLVQRNERGELRKSDLDGRPHAIEIAPELLFPDVRTLR